MQVAKQLHPNALETSPEKSLAGVRFFETSRSLRRSLASVNPNCRNIAIFHHVTLGISGLHCTAVNTNSARFHLSTVNPEVEERGKYTCAVPTKKSRSFVKLKLRMFLRQV